MYSSGEENCVHRLRAVKWKIAVSDGMFYNICYIFYGINIFRLFLVLNSVSSTNVCLIFLCTVKKNLVYQDFETVKKTYEKNQIDIVTAKSDWQLTQAYPQ